MCSIWSRKLRTCQYSITSYAKMNWKFIYLVFAYFYFHYFSCLLEHYQVCFVEVLCCWGIRTKLYVLKSTFYLIYTIKSSLIMRVMSCCNLLGTLENTPFIPNILLHLLFHNIQHKYILLYIIKIYKKLIIIFTLP